VVFGCQSGHRFCCKCWEGPVGLDVLEIAETFVAFVPLSLRPYSEHLLKTSLSSSPNGHEAVLTIAPLDDSDGNLSLAVKWSSSWGMRDQSSLPPYWVLIKGTIPPRPDINAEAGKNQRVPGARATTEKGEAQNSKPASLAEAGENPANTGETPVSKTAKYIPLIEEAPPVRIIELQ
jgi:hypothetical protein